MMVGSRTQVDVMDVGTAEHLVDTLYVAVEMLPTDVIRLTTSYLTLMPFEFEASAWLPSDSKDKMKNPMITKWMPISRYRMSQCVRQCRFIIESAHDWELSFESYTSGIHDNLTKEIDWSQRRPNFGFTNRGTRYMLHNDGAGTTLTQLSPLIKVFLPDKPLQYDFTITVDEVAHSMHVDFHHLVCVTNGAILIHQPLPPIKIYDNLPPLDSLVPAFIFRGDSRPTIQMIPT